MQEVSIPRYIDDQYQVLFWEIDEVAIVVLCFGLGIMFNMLAAMVLVGFGFLYWFRRFKYNHMDGILLHLFFWLGIMKLDRRLFPNGLDREFIS